MAAFSRRELQDRALRGSLWTLGNVLVSLPLGIVANAVTARLLGPSEYGSLAFLLAFVAIAMPLSELGVGQALVQWGVAAESRGDRAMTKALLGRRTGFALLVQLPVLSLVGMWLLRDADAWLRVSFLVTTLVLLMGASAQAVLLLEQRMAASAKIATAVGIVVQAGVILVALRTKEATPVWATRLFLAGLAPVAAAWLIRPTLRRAALRPRLPTGFPAGFWRFALLSWVAGASALLVFSRSEVFVLRFYGQAGELGLFALAFGLSQQLTSPVDLLLSPLFPASAGLVNAHPEHLRAALLRMIRFFGVLTGGLATLVPTIYLVTPVIFGDEFARSALLFLPLAIGSTFQSVASPFVVFAYARREGGLLARASVIALAVDLAIAMALVAIWGAWGAVIANVIGQVTAVVILARSELQVQGTALRELVHAARSWLFGMAALAIALVVGLLVRSAGAPLLAAGASAVVGLVSYGAILRASGGVLTKGDGAALLGAVPTRLQPLVRPLLWAAVAQPRTEAAS